MYSKYTNIYIMSQFIMGKFPPITCAVNYKSMFPLFVSYIHTHITYSVDMYWKLYLLPTPGKAKAKAMPGKLYIYTINKINK